MSPVLMLLFLIARSCSMRRDSFMLNDAVKARVIASLAKMATALVFLGGAVWVGVYRLIAVNS